MPARKKERIASRQLVFNMYPEEVEQLEAIRGDRFRISASRIAREIVRRELERRRSLK